MRIVDTFTATIWIGLKEGYDGDEHDISFVELICQDYCNRIGLAVTVTPTKFIYTKGSECGCAVGLINYPRFPSDPGDILVKALELAGVLKRSLMQYRVSIVCSDKTYLLEDDI